MDEIEKLDYDDYDDYNEGEKINELIRESKDLRKAYHAEMNALNGFVSELLERIKKLEEKDG